MSEPKRMKAVIFAGGVGYRMWPLSRKASPKQFEPIIEGKSTLQLAVARLLPEFLPEDIYISTGQQYLDIIRTQLPEIPTTNLIGEPEMRDCGPAVGYVMSLIAAEDPDAPTAILWSDHLVEQVDVFKKVLLTGAKLLSQNPNRFVFIGQRPRFPNQNLGWIEQGKVIDNLNDLEVREFKSWHYRPQLEQAKAYFASGNHAWNPGYFVVTPRFVMQKYQQHAPKLYDQIQTIAMSLGTPQATTVLEATYPQMEKISFDDAVVTKTAPEEAVVIAVELGWSDIGTWEALKEALQSNPTENIQNGLVKTLNTENSIIYSYTDQLVTAIDMTDVTIVVTKDAIMVAPQRSIPKIKELLKTFEGSPLEKYT